MGTVPTSLASLLATGALLAGIGEWKSAPDMPLPRGGLQVAVLGGRVLVAGGSHWEQGQKRWSRRADWFDPQTLTWTEAPPLPAPRSDAATVATGEALYLLGGVRGGIALDDVLVWIGGAWRPAPEMTLPGPRAYAGAARAGSRIFLAGGLTDGSKYQTASATFWEFDLTNTAARWRALPPIPGPGRFLFAMVADNDSLFVFGGAAAERADSVRNLADAYRFDLATKKWQRLHDLPQPNRALAGAGGGSEILLAGGYSTDFLSRTWFYSTRTDSFREGPSLAHAVADGRLAVTGTRIVFVGGEPAPRVRAAWTLVAHSTGGESKNFR
ncbi:MAG: hypothetical protein IT160_03210 [Bryobacterales bacterium]|nr:hypothetical protein [Bryobacterales bacterium]